MKSQFQNSSLDDPELDELIDRLAAAYQPLRIYLFGSRSRGDESADSDYDILIVVSQSAAAERKRSRLAYEALWGTGIAADVLVTTDAWFDERVHLQASLPGTIVREGQLLYAA